MSVTAELVLDAHAGCAEGPVWDARRQELLWVDIPSHLVHVFDLGTGADRAFNVGRPVGAVARRTSGGLVLALEGGFGLLDELTGKTEIITSVGEAPNSLMNDGKCDPSGRFWAGTLSEPPQREKASLYRLESDLSVATVMKDVTISNGLGWSPDRNRMYYVDTDLGGLDIFDYDVATGDIDARRRLVDIPPEIGVPDGLTVDTEGYIWLAIYGGYSVRRYSPDGVLDDVVELPVAQATSCTFGGPTLEDLYITTGSEDFSARQWAREPHAGGLFRCKPGVKGLPANEFAG